MDEDKLKELLVEDCIKELEKQILEGVGDWELELSVVIFQGKIYIADNTCDSEQVYKIKINKNETIKYKR